MKCFEHAKSGGNKDAVAVCSNCGAGLCMEHLIEDVMNVARTNQKTRSILCHTCANIPEAQHK